VRKKGKRRETRVKLDSAKDPYHLKDRFRKEDFATREKIVLLKRSRQRGKANYRLDK